MLRFSIFGIPVNVDPWFWAMAFFLGSGFQHLQKGTMIFVVAWMLILFVSILVHELGHAIVGHKLGGGSTWIKLWAFGGLAYHQAARFTPRDRRLMILAGPAAGLCLFVLTCLAMMIIWPGETGRQLMALAIGYGDVYGLNNEARELLANHYIKFDIFNQLIWVNLWWSLVNLLPIFPLDGGQLADTYIKSPKRLHMIGMIFAGLVIVTGAYITQSMFLVVMFAFFAWQNYQAYTQAKY